MTLAAYAAAMEELLAGLKRDSRTFVDLGFFDEAGRMLSYAGPYLSLLGRSYGQEPWFTSLAGSEQEVVITDDAFLPAQLVARVDSDVTIRNDTGTTKEVEFINGPADETTGARSSGPIEPGASFTFHPETQRSITYQLAGQPEFRAAIFVDIANYVP